MIGYTVFYMGAIPGLLIVISGIRLLMASRSAKRLNYNLRFIQTEKNIYNETFYLFSFYFRLQAIIIILLFIGVVSITLMGFYYNTNYIAVFQQEFLKTIPFP